MPLHTAEALILRTYALGEADRIVVFLTRDRGKKRGVARSARRPRSRFMGALEPLTRVRIAYFERETRELVRLNYVETLRSPLSLAGDALGHVGYFAELIDEWCPENDPSERLFRLGASVIEALAAGATLEPVARYFEYWLLRLQGVYPSVLACQPCGGSLAEGAKLRLSERVLVCRRCGRGGTGPALSPDAIRFLQSLRGMGPADLTAGACSPRADRELEAAHRALIVAHLEKELRSIRVLREIGR